MVEHELVGLFLQDPRVLTAAELLLYALGGLVGALLKEIVSRDGALILPTVRDGKLHLGFAASLLPGMVMAILADGNVLTAIASGFAATTLLDRYLNTPQKVQARLSKRQLEEGIIAEVEARKDG